MKLDLFGNEPTAAPCLTDWRPSHWEVDASWQPLVSDFFGQPRGQQLGSAIQARLRQGAVMYPTEPLRALALTPLPQVKVVILGQDPYHGPHQAEGLAFSVAPGVKIPPSLRNIFKEIVRDGQAQGQTVNGDPSSGGLSDVTRRTSGSLVHWAAQGVLLLNTCLTVEDGQPASHAKLGWEALTDKIIQTVWALERPVVFMLWGAHAQNKQVLMAPGPGQQSTTYPHLVLTANHPSPLSALRSPQPFMGCGHFSKANRHLQVNGCEPVWW